MCVCVCVCVCVYVRVCMIECLAVLVHACVSVLCSTAEATNFPALSPQTSLILGGQLDFFRCIASPHRQWLRDGQVVSTSLSLAPSVPGFYQCVGLVANRPETAITGEIDDTGNTTITYLLETCKLKHTQED